MLDLSETPFYTSKWEQEGSVMGTRRALICPSAHASGFLLFLGRSFSRGALAKDLPSPPQTTFALDPVPHAPNLTDSTSFAFQHMTPGAAWPMDAPESWGSRSAVSARARWGPAGRRSSGALRVWDSGVPEEGDPGSWAWLSKVPTAPTPGETPLYKS